MEKTLAAGEAAIFVDLHLLRTLWNYIYAARITSSDQ